MLGAFFGAVARQAGRRAPTVKLPIAPLMPLAWVMERVAGVTGKTPRMTTEMLKMAHKKMFFDSGKAMRELGYAPRPAEAAIADALAFFRAEGLIR